MECSNKAAPAAFTAVVATATELHDEKTMESKFNCFSKIYNLFSN